MLLASATGGLFCDSVSCWPEAQEPTHVVPLPEPPEPPVAEPAAPPDEAPATPPLEAPAPPPPLPLPPAALRPPLEAPPDDEPPLAEPPEPLPPEDDDVPPEDDPPLPDDVPPETVEVPPLPGVPPELLPPVAAPPDPLLPPWPEFPGCVSELQAATIAQMAAKGASFRKLGLAVGEVMSGKSPEGHALPVEISCVRRFSDAEPKAPPDHDVRFRINSRTAPG